jgi:hypothetical protein
VKWTCENEVLIIIIIIIIKGPARVDVVVE